MSAPGKLRWYDDAKLLINDFQETASSRSASLTESRTYAQMLFARPGDTVKLGEAFHVFSPEGLRELGFNSFAESAETTVSQVARPLKSKVTPVGGTWRQKRTCEALGQLIDGNLVASSFPQIATQLVWDGMWATEAFAVWENDGKSNLRCTRLDPLESFMSSDGKEFKTRRRVPRRQVLARFGKTDELKAKIKLLDTYEPEAVLGADVQGAFGTEDCVAVYEAWYEHLPGEDKGKHVIQLAPNMVVVDDPWEAPVPIIRYRWSQGLRGPADGVPMGRAVGPLMAIENQMHLKVSDAIAASVPIVKGKNDPKLTNAPYQFIKEDPNDDKVGTVTIDVPKVVSEEVRTHISDVRDRIRARTGVSESTAAGEPPPQFKSGIALQRYIGLLNKRLSQQHYNHLRLYEDSAKLNVILGPKVWGDKAKIAAADGTSIIEQIEWDKVKLPEEAYRISFDAISDMPDRVPTKDELLELVKDMGIMDAVDLLANLNTPDYLRRVEVLTGPRNYIEFQISQALDEGVIEPPNDMQDKATLAKAAAEAWQAARCQKVRPDPSHMDALFILWELAGTTAAPAAGAGVAGPMLTSEPATAGAPAAEIAAP